MGHRHRNKNYGRKQKKNEQLSIVYKLGFFSLYTFSSNMTTMYKCYTSSPPNTFFKSEPKKKTKNESEKKETNLDDSTTNLDDSTTILEDDSIGADLLEWIENMPVNFSDFSGVSDSLDEDSSPNAEVENWNVITTVAVEIVTKVAEIEKLIADLKAQQLQLKELGKRKRNAQQDKKDPQYIKEKKKRENDLASILSDIKYKQVALDNIKNPLPTNIDEANQRVSQETQAENVRRVNLSMSILPEKKIRFFKGIAKKLNKRGVSYSATITNNGHNTMLGSWNNYTDAVLTIDHTKKLQKNNGVLFYQTIDQDDYYSAQMAKRLPKKGGKLTMPTFLPSDNAKKQVQIQKDDRKHEQRTV